MTVADVTALIAERLERYRVNQEYRLEYSSPLDWAARRSAASRLVARADAYDVGLSNDTYQAALSGRKFLRLEVRPARVVIGLSDDIDANGSFAVLPSGGGIRGAITELSEQSRNRLADKAASLAALGYEPSYMVTLTSPANWESVYIHNNDGEPLNGGRIFKAHLAAFRRRLDRVFRKFKVTWSALWFLEFQRRGAPHIHLMLFNCSLSDVMVRYLRRFLGVMWSEIVGNFDEHELDKHRRAGTQLAKMRCNHFGYAMKYASKMEQKKVPSEFSSVGRFWGVWNSPEIPCIELNFDVATFEEKTGIKNLLDDILSTIKQYSMKFALSRFFGASAYLDADVIEYDSDVFGAGAVRTVSRYGFSVYGAAASAVVFEYLKIKI